MRNGRPPSAKQTVIKPDIGKRSIRVSYQMILFIGYTRFNPIKAMFLFFFTWQIGTLYQMFYLLHRPIFIQNQNVSIVLLLRFFSFIISAVYRCEKAKTSWLPSFQTRVLLEKLVGRLHSSMGYRYEQILSACSSREVWGKREYRWIVFTFENIINVWLIVIKCSGSRLNKQPKYSAYRQNLIIAAIH